jgi:hypothetical protein
MRSFQLFDLGFQTMRHPSLFLRSNRLSRAVAAGVLASAMFASQASAAAVSEYRLTLTLVSSGATSYWFEFADADGDALCSLDELTTWSHAAAPGHFVWNAPTLAGISDGGYTIGSPPLAAWRFHIDFGAGATTSSKFASLYNYALLETTPPPADVPLPATALLLLGAGGALAAAGRRRR